MEVPCFYNIDDKYFFAYLQGLHELARVERQTLFNFSLRVLGRVDISEVRVPKCHLTAALLA